MSSDSVAAEVPPLRCPRCAGEVEVDTEVSGYYRDVRVVAIRCGGGAGSSVGWFGCGAAWDPSSGDPLTGP